MRKPRVPSYRLHKPSGNAVVTLAGKDIYLGTYNSTESREAYDRRIGEWLASGRQAPAPSASGDNGLTVVELIARFMTHASTFYVRPDGTPTSEAATLAAAMGPLKALYGSTSAIDFGPMGLRAVREKMISMGWSRKSINHQIARIRHMFKWAASQELVPASIHVALATVAGLKAGKSAARETAKIRPVPKPMLDATIEHMPPVVRDMVLLQLVTGMRSGELLTMRTCDIDTSGDVWTYTLAQHKTAHHGHTREVMIGPRGQEILANRLRPNVREFIFRPEDAEAWRKEQCKTHRHPSVRKSRRISDRKLNDRYSVVSYHRAIAYACVKAYPLPDHLARQRVAAAGRKEKSTRWETLGEWKDRIGTDGWKAAKAWRKEHHWHPHQLRHNAATELRREFGIEAARIILGHRSAAITEVYAEQDRSKAQEIVRKIG